MLMGEANKQRPKVTLEEIAAKCLIEDGCWVWEGAGSGRDQPKWNFERGLGAVMVRRLMAEHQGLKLGRNMVASRNCVTENCVWHVKVRSRASVIREAVESGVLGGAAHRAAVAAAKQKKGKLNMEKVAEMRALRAQGLSFRELGERFGCHMSNAAAVCNYQSWRPVCGSSVFNFRGRG